MNLSSQNSNPNFKLSNLVTPRNILKSFLDFVAPHHCIICNDYIGTKECESKFLCNKCYYNMPFADSKDFIINKIISNFDNNKCYINEATSLLNFRDSNNYIQIVHYLKYQKFQSIGIEFSKLLANRIKLDNMANYDFIVPIPIHKVKKRERGFNQSDIIAETISKELNITLSNQIIFRNKYTISQTILSKSERKQNVDNVFSIHDNINIKNKSILLIDDVLTTGSTLNNAAEILVNSGASKIGVATIIFAN